jgi:hexosaminidase
MRDDLWPAPRRVAPAGGEFVLGERLRVSAPDPLRGAALVFADDLAGTTGQHVEVTAGSECEIELRQGDLGPEAYRLEVAERVVVTSSDLRGAGHAFTTLRQLGPDALWGAGGPPTWSIGRGVVEDEPHFSWRGAHLDVARHFFDVEVIERFIDLLALHRLNVLHLHLNDDQGWRVEVPSWPRLTEVGAWRRSSPLGHERDGRDDDVAHGGFYDAGDLARIAERARRRGVTVVPEIDLPGHAQAVLAAYPELGNGEPAEVWTRWGISRRILAPSPAALDFAEEVVAYVAGLFPGNPVHIGGDECPTAEWTQSELAAMVMAEHGFDEARQLQGLFTARLAEALRERGHEVLAWDEVLDAAVPEGTVIVAWRSEHEGRRALARGFEVVMAPMQVTYFDWPNATGPDEPVAQTAPDLATPWERVYAWTVVPEGVGVDEAVRVRGGQGQLWSEYIATRDHLDYMAFPRLCALAEVLWGTVGDLDEARRRLAGHLGRLAAAGVGFRPLDRSPAAGES